jgi:methylenetetrahydrofolate dehydrogenase (NADP+)/methenyltetrahydrofolate cyclohydrolase
VSARIIDGKAIAKKIRAEQAEQVERLVARHGVRPGLAVILVGSNPASRVYVRNKIAACREVGIRSDLIELPSEITQAELLRRIDALNADPGVHGLLIQLPLPAHIEMASVLERIDIEKDVDGFHLYNVGGLVTGNTIFPPCTPFGGQKQREHECIARAGGGPQRRRRGREQHRR